MQSRRFAVASLFLIGGMAAAAPCAWADMTIRFVNHRPDASLVPAYVSFGGAGTFSATNLATNTPLAKGVSYPLSSLSKGISLQEFKSGRIYISLGKLTTPSAANGYSPNFDNPDLGDFTTRWDKVEITYKKGAGGANLTAQDFFGMPLKIVAKGGGQARTVLASRKETAVIMRMLARLADNKIITKKNASGAVALGNNGVSVPDIPGGNVVRIVSPASVAPKTTAGATVYPSFAPYIRHLRTGNEGKPIHALLVGNNGTVGKGGPLQSYRMNAMIHNVATKVGGTQVKAGDLVVNGHVDSGSGEVKTTILVPASNLSDHAIYGANPSYTIINGADTNGVVEKVLADYFAALNFGFIGSTVDNPKHPAKSIGASPSWTWYGNPPNGNNRDPLSIEDAFAHAQPDVRTHYNQYAGYLVRVSDAYGFAYNDRLQSPLAPLGDGSVMTVLILPDKR